MSHMLDDGGPREHLILIPEQKIQQGIFLIGQRDFGPSPPHSMGRGIEFQSAAFSLACSCGPPRRNSALALARSSAKANGFVR